jgi:TnpA family transposase
VTRPIRWALIRHQYDHMSKYATAVRLGPADAETIRKRFTRSHVQPPTYQALTELGQAVKTMFRCQDLHQDAGRRELHDGLQVIEHWNSANAFIFYGKGGEMASNRLEDQELAMLALHLLQMAMGYMNTVMIQPVLTDDGWWERMTPDDLRALTPLISTPMTPDGTFRRDMNERLP